jgi:hypothetical protein
MCNLYSMTKGQQAIRDLVRASRDNSGNLPPLPSIFPDMLAPVVLTTPDGERELLRMRWGMPCPPQFGTQPVTNIRNTASPHWRRWLGPVSPALRRQTPSASRAPSRTSPQFAARSGASTHRLIVLVRAQPGLAKTSGVGNYQIC